MDNKDTLIKVGNIVEYKTTYGVRSGILTRVNYDDCKSHKVKVGWRNEAVYEKNIRPKGFYTNKKK